MVLAVVVVVLMVVVLLMDLVVLYHCLVIYTRRSHKCSKPVSTCVLQKTFLPTALGILSGLHK